MPPDPRFSPPTCCALATDRWNEGRLRYSEAYHGWVLPICTPTVVFFCPWCGQHLPEVKR